MRASAERAAGVPLGWFFRQWIHEVGVVDYALRDVGVEEERGGWVMHGTVVRMGRYEHPMAVGVRTASGWKIERTAVGREEQAITVRTSERPLEIRLDPHGAAGAPAARFYDFAVSADGARPSVRRLPPAGVSVLP